MLVHSQEHMEGPFNQLIIRGVTLINGNGAPPMGPVDISVENNKITGVHNVGYPGVEINESARPKLKDGGKELDATGMYLLPGFIDMHGHIGGKAQGATPEYVFKLWMAHGVTTVREVGGPGIEWTQDLQKKIENKEMAGPRIISYTVFGNGSEKPITTPEEAREWVRKNADAGADGIKFFGAAPGIMKAALEENARLGKGSAMHHAQLSVGRWNVLNSAKAGLTSMEHWYGLPEALFDDKTVQHYPLDYNYQNEQHRFAEAGKLWAQATEPGSEHWNQTMDTLLALDFTLDPTFNIYEASRDLMRARRAEWHETYTLPSLWKFYQPSKISHGSYWHYWGTEEEVAWRENFRIWMQFVNDYKNRGGRVTTGSDSGFIFQLYGFAYVRELELLREAGFHPLEVIRAATLNGAEAIGMEDKLGTVEPGKLADFVIVEENPLQNFKVLYGTGAIKLTEDNEVVRVGGVKYTIKDGIIYDSKGLLNEVEQMVEKAKEEEDFRITQPGMD
ncbi:amidohydrolase family protein [Gramella sp. GC03-9]|uniref:Amidohydrolase family protein n=2 Tax=Christiangramia oceanisediminis TaxID=2920386 RepID=A0A9X2I2D0_9FLAO|nr:amidohydrolase family protein [Gramella oceanisediminis]MCP9199939.1 amidohydrolase family protein [Gramella oceanisediminis]